MFIPLVSVRDTPFHILSWCRNVTLRSSFYPGTGTWHPIHILSWCRNVTLRSSFYPGTGTWHPIHILSWCRNVTLQSSSYYPGVGTWHSDPYTILESERDTRSSITILVPERDTRSTNLILLVHQAFFYIKTSSLTKRVLGLSFTTLSFQPITISYSHHASIQLSI